MGIEKFDNRLMEEVAKKKKEIETRKIAAEEVMIPVVIEHTQRLTVPRKERKKEMISNLKEEASKIQRPLIEKLVSLGVKRGKIKQQWISNMLSAELTIEQIEKIAELDDVKMVKL